ncbi:MAG: ABC transporter ATP-binding protein [Kiloniellales bacterium]|nr:ABC transporter ATP-binding protein [Kiloniellales bacterium]
MQLALNDVGKRFGEVPALQGLSLEVEAGEFFVLLGPSAAGKTTTLRVISGLERPDSGQVLFEDQDLTFAPVQGRPMAMIFQTFALYPHLTVRGNLSYALKEARVEAAELTRQVDEVAEMLRITHTLERQPGTLSGGEQQRVAIGRALVRRPQLLLLDEPLTNLDAKLRHDTRAEFKRLHRELGMTMVYATPDQLEALTMGQRIAVIRDGAVVQTGSADALYDRPADDFVAGLVGAPTINLLPARRAGGDGPAAAVALHFMEVAGGIWSQALAKFGPGTDLWFGIRPHDLSPVEETPRGPHFEATVHLTEPLGDVTLLDLLAGEQPLRMVLPEERAVAYAVGDRIRVEIALENTHVFTRETGTAIR